MATLEQEQDALQRAISAVPPDALPALRRIVEAFAEALAHDRAARGTPERAELERALAQEMAAWDAASDEALLAHLQQTFSTPKAGRDWLRDANRYLGGLAPAEALRAGRADRIEAALEALDSGVFI